MITSSPQAQNAQVYEQLKNWFDTELVPALKTDYGLQSSVFGVTSGLPFVDNSTGLNYVENFYLTIGGWVYPLYYGTYALFENNVPAFESLAVSAYNQATGSGVQHLINPTPAPANPVNPIGDLINDGTNLRYMNVSGINGHVPYPIGFVYTDITSNQKYVLKGSITPWGPQVWWEKVA